MNVKEGRPTVRYLLKVAAHQDEAYLTGTGSGGVSGEGDFNWDLTRVRVRYYLTLRTAPKSFKVWMNLNEGRLAVQSFSKVVAHQAAAQLSGGRGLGDRLKREVLIGVWL